jgi:sugar/nucleoside kinase (ribokinase family)
MIVHSPANSSAMHAPATPPPRIVAIGETLWDLLPDGAVWGGAPGNVVCHAAGLIRESLSMADVLKLNDEELPVVAAPRRDAKNHGFHRRFAGTGGQAGGGASRKPC